MDERSRLLEQAGRCRRVAEDIDEPATAAALRRLADKYARRAEAILHPDEKSDAIEASASDPAQESALAILRMFEEARVKLIGKGVVLSNGKAGTIEKVLLA